MCQSIMTQRMKETPFSLLASPLTSKQAVSAGVSGLNTSSITLHRTVIFTSRLAYCYSLCTLLERPIDTFALNLDHNTSPSIGCILYLLLSAPWHSRKPTEMCSFSIGPHQYSTEKFNSAQYTGYDTSAAVLSDVDVLSENICTYSRTHHTLSPHRVTHYTIFLPLGIALYCTRFSCPLKYGRLIMSLLLVAFPLPFFETDVPFGPDAMPICLWRTSEAFLGITWMSSLTRSTHNDRKRGESHN